VSFSYVYGKYLKYTIKALFTSTKFTAKFSMKLPAKTLFGHPTCLDHLGTNAICLVKSQGSRKVYCSCFR